MEGGLLLEGVFPFGECPCCGEGGLFYAAERVRFYLCGCLFWGSTGGCRFQSGLSNSIIPHQCSYPSSFAYYWRLMPMGVVRVASLMRCVRKGRRGSEVDVRSTPNTARINSEENTPPPMLPTHSRHTKHALLHSTDSADTLQRETHPSSP